MSISRFFTCQTGNLKPFYIHFNNDGIGKQNVNGEKIGNNRRYFIPDSLLGYNGSDFPSE